MTNATQIIPTCILAQFDQCLRWSPVTYLRHLYYVSDRCGIGFHYANAPDDQILRWWHTVASIIRRNSTFIELFSKNVFRSRWIEVIFLHTLTDKKIIFFSSNPPIFVHSTANCFLYSAIGITCIPGVSLLQIVHLSNIYRMSINDKVVSCKNTWGKTEMVNV